MDEVTAFVRRASADPYGDPADQRGAGQRNIKPASADPYGDPADAPLTTRIEELLRSCAAPR